MLAILAAAGTPVWPVIVTAIISFCALTGSSVIVGLNNRKWNRIQRQDAAQKEKDHLTSSNIAAQVDLTKDVLDNWKDIVRSLGQQIGDLHGQVAALENRERNCQIELMGVKARLIEVEGRLTPNKGGGDA